MPDKARLEMLSSRVHFFVRPAYREAFIAFFRDTLGCASKDIDAGLEFPVFFVTLPGGGSFSVEFTSLAPEPSPSRPIGDPQALRGAWLEFRSADPRAVERALTETDTPSFKHKGSPHTYFIAPGGQVFRIVDLQYQGP